MEVFGYIVKIDDTWFLKGFVCEDNVSLGPFGSTTYRTAVKEFSVTSACRDAHIFTSKAQASELALLLKGVVVQLCGELI